MPLTTSIVDRKVRGGDLEPVVVVRGIEVIEVEGDVNATVVGNVNTTVVGDVEVVQPNHDDLNANANIQVNDIDVSDANPVPVDDVWTVALASDETLNDSDKTITVTANQLWHVLWIWVELTTTVAVGDRQIVVELQDGANDVIAQFRAGAVQAASLTRYYCFAPSLADLTAFRDTNYLMTPFPPTVLLPATFQVRVWDNKAIAAAADDMVVQIQHGVKVV